MRIVACIVLAIYSVLPTYAAEPVAPSDSERPSVANTQTIEFLGRKFELKFKDTDKPVRIYEYYLPNETPDSWLELVEFQIYSVSPEGDTPMGLATRTAAAFKKKYPHMQFALLSNDNTDAAMLDFLYPTSTRKEKGKDFLEFDVFKFFRDASSHQIMCVHYAKNIEANSKSRPMDDVVADGKKTRREALPAIADFPRFRP